MGNPLNEIVINFWLDALLLLTFLAPCWTAIVVLYVFPTPQRTDGWTLWGLDYLAWTDVQFSIHCVVVGGFVVHLMFDGGRACGVVNRWHRKRRWASRHTGCRGRSTASLPSFVSPSDE